MNNEGNYIKEYQSELDNKPELNKKSENNLITISNYLTMICYITLIASVFVRFIPVAEGNWYGLGMGKLVAISAFYGLYSIIKKDYFIAFFISLFASFFVIHEVIVFYDSYAVEMGKELTPNGAFRMVFDLFKDAFQIKFGAFWAGISSWGSMLLVLFSWIYSTYLDNYKKP